MELGAGVEGPVSVPPRKQTVCIPKYRPYSWTRTSADTFEAPKRLWRHGRSTCPRECRPGNDDRADLPSRRPLDERQQVRRVTVYFIGREKNEYGVGGAPPSRLEHVERSQRVDAEIGEGVARGPIVRGLRRGVDDEFDVGP